MIEIYTDGACSGNPGPGGWGVLLRIHENETELCGGEAATTNNRMELLAVIEALQSLTEPMEALIYTDSQYVQKGISEWIHSWKRRGWKTTSNQPVKNEDLWRRLDALAASHTIEWRWVKGHAGHPDNERVDALARAGLEQARRGGLDAGDTHRRRDRPETSEPLHVQIARAQPQDADVVAMLVGELLHEIMAAVQDKVFRFHQAETVGRARSWIEAGTYTVLIARAAEEPAGFLALYESYALYTNGLYGTIPELYVRPAYRSQGIGTALVAEASTIGKARGWTRLEVTTPPLPQFNRTLVFYQTHGFSMSGGRKLKKEL